MLGKTDVLFLGICNTNVFFSPRKKKKQVPLNVVGNQRLLSEKRDKKNKYK